MTMTMTGRAMTMTMNMTMTMTRTTSHWTMDMTMTMTARAMTISYDQHFEIQINPSVQTLPTLSHWTRGTGFSMAQFTSSEMAQFSMVLRSLTGETHRPKI